MHSSPDTPTGTGSSLPSTTYVLVFAIGPPIGGAPSPQAGTTAAVATTVHSVGP